MKKFFLFFLAYLSICLISFSDTIILKNGKKIEGDIVTDSNNIYMIKTPYGNLFIKSEEVKSVKKDSLEIKQNQRRFEQATDFFQKALRLKKQKKLPQALSFLHNAKQALNEISDDSNKKLFDDLSTSEGEIHEIIKKNSIKIYKDLMLNKEDLEYHLDNGFQLINNKFWIKELCGKCDAKGKLLCLKCKGQGYEEMKCNRCKNGKIPCDKCFEKGIITCDYCHGEGFSLCSECIGNRQIQCYSCNGKGIEQMGCDMCGGRRGLKGGGVVIRQSQQFDNWGNKVWTNVEQTCPRCQGSGWITNECRHCNGSGITNCKNCGGSGEIQCRYCFSKGQRVCTNCESSGKENCSICYGYGYTEKTCIECNGTKAIVCKECSGKGFFGEIKEAKVIKPEELSI